MSAPAVTFVLVACAYALGLCPSLYWLDSGELAGAGWELGIAHAPGHPLAALVEKLFMLLPIGDLALRAGLSQLFCGAGAAAIVTWLSQRLAPRSVTLAVAAGLLYASSFAAAFQAIRPEVYALSSLLVLATIALVWRYTDDGDARYLAWAGLCFGLGLTNHHYLVLVGVIPPAVALLVPRFRSPGFFRALLRAALATALGLGVYVYLPLRAAHHPLFDWGHPTSLANFYWVVSAQSFQKAANGGAQGDLGMLIGALFDQLTPMAPLLALGGLYVLARRSLGLAIAMLLMFLGPVVGRLFVSFDAGNPDAFGYLGTGIVALALLCVPLLAEIADATRGWVGPLALALVIIRAVVVAPGLSLRHFDDTRAVFAPYIEQAPPHALVVTSYFQTSFALDYLRVVEGARPDVTYVPRHFLAQPGLRDALLLRDPALSALLGAGDIVSGAMPSRPLVLEYDLDLDPSLIAQSSTIPTPRLSPELQTRRFVVWEATLALHRACRLGEETNAAERKLRALSPNDPFVDDLAKSCARLRVEQKM